MNLMKQKGKKQNFFDDVKGKFIYTYDGFVYAFKNESSFIYITLALIANIILGIVFKISFFEWVITIGSVMLMLLVEFLNTGIEAAVDLVTSDFNKFAKIAKDCGSSATFIAIIVFALVMLYVFLPKIFPGIF